MPHCRFVSIFLVLLMFPPFLLGMSKKSPFTISFHAQATSDDPPKMRVGPVHVDGRDIYFKLAPEISHANIAGYYPFKADDGTSNGLLLRLDAHGRSQLDILSHSEDGGLLLAVVNQKPVDFMVLDKWVQDGIITIWRGVPDETVKLMEKKYPKLKPNSAPISMSQDIQMDPTTRKEKQDALRESQLREAYEREQAKKGKTNESPKRLEVPDPPATGPNGQYLVPPQPRAPGDAPAPPSTTNRIPVEGGSGLVQPSPIPPIPGEPPLPRQ
jgi:hypothetical protein